MFVGIEHQIHRVFNGHHEARHVGIGEGEGFAGPDLIHEEGDYRAAGSHHVAIARAAEHGSGAVEVPGAGNHHLLAQRLGEPYGVDGINRLVGAEDDHLFHSGPDRRIEHVVAAQHVGAHRLDGKELTGKNPN